MPFDIDKPSGIVFVSLVGIKDQLKISCDNVWGVQPETLKALEFPTSEDKIFISLKSPSMFADDESKAHSTTWDELKLKFCEHILYLIL